jgi:hypothetical protein
VTFQARQAWPTLVLTLAFLGGGCFIDPIDLDERLCDDDRPCVNGYDCIDGTCERVDGGPADDDVADENNDDAAAGG